MKKYNLKLLKNCIIKGNIKKLDDLEKFKPQKLSEVIKWFESYKGKNIIEFKRLDKIDEAYKMINQSSRYYKRYGIRPRS